MTDAGLSRQAGLHPLSEPLDVLLGPRPVTRHRPPRKLCVDRLRVVAHLAKRDDYIRRLRATAETLSQSDLRGVAYLCRITPGPCICGCHISQVD